jgi:hypothetical protein
MELDLTPLEWDWTPVTKGDTFPSIRIQETSSEVDCARVRVKIKASGVATASLELDSDASGITITDGTAGAWDFTIDTITAAQTASLSAGFYTYDIETTDAAGNVKTEFCGTWQILPQITD